MKDFQLTNIIIIENIKMDDLSTIQTEFYLELAKSQAVEHSFNWKKINIGKYFLSRIKKFKNGFVFEKIKEIEMESNNKVEENKIEQDSKFYFSKWQNLFQRSIQNRMELRDKADNEYNYKMSIEENSWIIESLDLQMKYKDCDLEKYNVELKDLKLQYYS